MPRSAIAHPRYQNPTSCLCSPKGLICTKFCTKFEHAARIRRRQAQRQADSVRPAYVERRKQPSRKITFNHDDNTSVTA
eukprot:6736737-Prymnesium_polylepis.1